MWFFKRKKKKKESAYEKWSRQVDERWEYFCRMTPGDPTDLILPPPEKKEPRSLLDDPYFREAYITRGDLNENGIPDKYENN